MGWVGLGYEGGSWRTTALAIAATTSLSLLPVAQRLLYVTYPLALLASPIATPNMPPSPSPSLLSFPRSFHPASSLSQSDQESKRKAARSVAAYMQLSDAVFTPYAEALYPATHGARGQAETRSGSQWWGSQSGGGDGRGGAERGGGDRRRGSAQRLEEIGEAGAAGEEPVRTPVVIIVLCVLFSCGRTLGRRVGGRGALRTPVVFFFWVCMLALSALELDDFGGAGGTGGRAVETPGGVFFVYVLLRSWETLRRRVARV